MNKPKTMAKAARPIMDVAHPGKSMPSATSKQIIISNRPIVKDPMMADTAPKSDAEAVPASATTLSHSSAAPPLLDPVTALPQPTDTTSRQPVGTESAAGSTDIIDTDQSAANVIDPTNPNAIDQKADNEALKQRTIDELIEKETYFLPITSAEQKRARQTIIIGIVLILILGAAWADIALDAGLVTINGWHAPTHFFSN